MNLISIVCAAMLLTGIVLLFMALIRPRRCDQCGANMEDLESHWECPHCGYRSHHP